MVSEKHLLIIGVTGGRRCPGIPFGGVEGHCGCSRGGCDCIGMYWGSWDGSRSPIGGSGEELGNVDVTAMKRRHVLCGRMIFMTSRLIAS